MRQEVKRKSGHTSDNCQSQKQRIVFGVRIKDVSARLSNTVVIATAKLCQKGDGSFNLKARRVVDGVFMP
jgi:hypothetical protein